MEYLDFAVAIRQQPDALEKAIASIRRSLEGLAVASWGPNQTVAVLAMGASSHSAHALVAALTIAGRRAVNLTPSELFDAPDDFEPGDHYIVVSESGRSPEPLKIAAGRTAPRIGITDYPEQAISLAVDSIISLGELEDSAVYSVGYTSTLIAYSFLARAAGVPDAAIEEDAVPALVAEALDRYIPRSEQIASHLRHAKSVDFVGRSFSYATATEAALMFREALAITATAFETYQYLHGPAEPGSAHTGLVIFGDSRELELAHHQSLAGVPVVLFTKAEQAALDPIRNPNLLIIEIPTEVRGLTQSIIEIVAVQAMTEAVARDRSISIETFNYTQPDTKLDEV